MSDDPELVAAFAEWWRKSGLAGIDGAELDPTDLSDLESIFAAHGFEIVRKP